MCADRFSGGWKSVVGMVNTASDGFRMSKIRTVVSSVAEKAWSSCREAAKKAGDFVE
jgi:hypothetical protein